jgi:hypothetical protein
MNESEQETILKRDALGRVAMSREQREALLDEFERSGLKGLVARHIVVFPVDIEQRGLSLGHGDES